MNAMASDAPARLAPDWLARLRRRLAPAPEHRPELWRIGSVPVAAAPALAAHLPAVLRPAAVLLPIFEAGGQPRLLLTVRAPHLRQHAGQISFPGGSLEGSDADPLAAALREAQEEVGIAAEYVEPLGFLCDHVVVTGFRITPIVALLRPGYTLRIADAEVAEVFDLPLESLLDPAIERPTVRTLRGVEVLLNDLHHDGRVIWGATAGILQSLRAILREPLT